MIEIKNLSFAYSSEKVLDNIITTFEQGRVYGLLGANGVGKSTLFKLLCGLLTTKEGSIEIDGYSPADRKPGFLSKMFYIPEDFEGPAVTIKNYASGISAFYPNYDEQLLHSLLKDFEIDINRKFTTLSLGQRKRAILCIALAMNSEYLLLDEPTNGLDIPSKLEFRKMVARTMDDKRTIIISTHQVKDVENLLDHIMILDKRAVLLDKSVVDIQNEYLFETSSTAPSDALFVEAGLGGCCSIRKNVNSEESRINIELLFNYINSKK
jgi:ABC-2 type transport system ATP-binding protein